MVKAQINAAMAIAAQQEAAIVKATLDNAVQMKAKENTELSTAHDTIKELEAVLMKATQANGTRKATSEQLQAKYEERLSNLQLEMEHVQDKIKEKLSSM